MDKANQAVEFLNECEKYLHSWLCTKDGKYIPYSTNKVYRVLLELVANGSKNPIADFKKGVNDGNILFSVYAIGLADNYRKELYEKHKQNVEEFEKKYHINNETD